MDCTGVQLEPFSMGKMYRGCFCHTFAKNAGDLFLMVAVLVCWIKHGVLRDVV